MLKRSLYGYEIRRELEEWGAEHWANISYSSIYLTLSKLTEVGMLVEVGTEQLGAQPARIKYEITDLGVREFQKALLNYWTYPQTIYDTFQIALTFMPLLSSEQLLDALAERTLHLQVTVAKINDYSPSHNADTPAHIQENLALLLAHLDAELGRIAVLVSNIRAGKLP